MAVRYFYENKYLCVVTFCRIARIYVVWHLKID